MRFELLVKRVASKVGVPVLEDVLCKRRPLSDLPIECIPWPGANTGFKMIRAKGYVGYSSFIKPYALIGVKGKKEYLHRWMFQTLLGLEGDFRLENQCGNTLCINPLHWKLHEREIEQELPEFEYDPDEEWTQPVVNALFDQAVASYSMTCWDDVKNNILLLDCPEPMLLAAIQDFRRSDLMP